MMPIQDLLDNLLIFSSESAKYIYFQTQIETKYYNLMIIKKLIFFLWMSYQLLF